ncbi:MAG: ATP-dependent zinc metalloprotease FtsH [Alphaproteobacteria bacterium]|nr:MAG: cell division protein FtsH [Rickettsiaceae bacterium 4572_127]
MKINLKYLLGWGIIGLAIFFAVSEFIPSSEKKIQNPVEMAFSDFIKQVEAGKIAEVKLSDKGAEGLKKDGTAFKTILGNYPNMYEIMTKNNVKFAIQPAGTTGFLAHAINIFPTLLWIFVLVLMIRSMKGASGKGGAFGIGKSRAKMLTEEKKKITFKDVAGIEEAKQDVEEIVSFLKNAKKFEKLGGRIPKGVLLSGQPGTGKTLLARAIAGEADVPFFSLSGSDFVEMFVGVGASRVRDLFEQGKKHAPCIIFIDEIDAVGRSRGVGYGGGNDEREQTLNQLLVEMDGFESNEGVILIAATNRPDVLDPALMRPGRFDRQIIVPLPDVKGREKIVELHLKKVKSAKDVSASIIARGTPGFSGAELENLVNESALIAARKNHKQVMSADFEDARDKILMGAERKSTVISPSELKNTAYHEAGHALCNIKLKCADPIHKVTIIPRGRALGMVQQLPEKDRISLSREKIEADIVIAMAGRISEEIFFGKDKVTTGAMSDIRMATNLARHSVTEWGLSEKLGPIAYEEAELGYGETRNRTNLSDETAREVDNEIRKMVEAGYKKAKEIISKNKKEVELIANALLEHETITGDDVKKLLEGKKINRKSKSEIVKKKKTVRKEGEK